MFFPTSIRLSEDLKLKLQEVPNTSELINDLLRDYFEKDNNALIFFERADKQLQQAQAVYEEAIVKLNIYSVEAAKKEREEAQQILFAQEEKRKKEIKDAKAILQGFPAEWMKELLECDTTLKKIDLSKKLQKEGKKFHTIDIINVYRAYQLIQESEKDD